MDERLTGRILVIGPGGAGKTTVAGALSERTGLPLVHLDAHYWRPGWVEPSKTEWEATVDRLVAEPEWVMDGNYGGTLERRIEACDAVVFLDLPPLLCIVRVLRRWWRGRGSTRPDMAPGCSERMSLDFLFWIWSYRRRRRPQIVERLGRLRADQTAVMLQRRRDVARFLDEPTFPSLAGSAGPGA